MKEKKEYVEPVMNIKSIRFDDIIVTSDGLKRDDDDLKWDMDSLELTM